MAETQRTQGTEWADTADAWIGRTHDATLPSGARVTYRDLTLGEMAARGDLPTDLLEIVVAEWAEPGGAARLAAAPLAALPDKPTKKQRETAQAQVRDVADRIASVNREMIAAALVSPTLTADELQGVPAADLELLSALINRQVVTDAAGRHVGVVPLDQFRVVLDAHGVECGAQGCEACEAAQRELSTSGR